MLFKSSVSKTDIKISLVTFLKGKKEVNVLGELNFQDNYVIVFTMS